MTIELAQNQARYAEDCVSEVFEWTDQRFAGCLCAECRSDGYGFVYILKNPSYRQGLLKVGFTQQHLDKRVDQLSSATSCPSRFRLVYAAYCYGARRVEAIVHRKLAEFRNSECREFFSATPQLIAKTIRAAAYHVSSEEDWEASWAAAGNERPHLIQARAFL